MPGLQKQRKALTALMFGVAGIATRGLPAHKTFEFCPIATGTRSAFAPIVAGVRKFEDLVAWQLACELRDEIDHELEGGKADGVERRVIGGRDGSWSNRDDAQVAERRDPLLENWPHGEVVLRPDATDAAGAVVRVENADSFACAGFNCMVAGSAKCSRSARELLWKPS